ncbi:MAG: response regulator [Bdellovibrionota bacterium]
MREHPIRVLYIEDSVAMQKMARLVLEKSGSFTVTICATGKEAIEQGPLLKPDLILADFHLPDMDGHQIVRTLREHPSLVRTPVVFVTASGDPQFILTLRDLGVLAVLPKPFNPLSLAPTLLRLWNEYFGGTQRKPFPSLPQIAFAMG